MSKTLLSIIGALCAFTSVIAQCGPSGTGLDGAYSATATTTLAGGTYNYTTFNIDAGVTVTVTGSQPLVIYCTGAATINGSLIAAGEDGNNGVTYVSAGTGGAGVAGGGNGGNGSFSSPSGPLNGISGNGSGAGGMGQGWSGGGGAGYSVSGASSGGAGGVGGPAYGAAAITGTDAGSGGGGGSGGYDCGAGGGGGGGGYITIQAASINISSSGEIRVNGGNGGSDGTGNCGGGGGGSGGSIWLVAPTMTNNGLLYAVGGTGGASAVPGSPYYGTGANGADGRIRLDYAGALGGSGAYQPAVGYTGTLNPVQTAAVVTQNVSCFGGSDGAALATNIGGTAPYVSSWSPSGGNTTVATGLSAGTYTYMVTDNNGCTATATVNISQPTQIQVTSAVTNNSCSGSCNGAITTTVSGGTPGYTYMWSPGGQTTPTVTNMCAGCYTLTVTDANGCVHNEVICVTEPSAISTTLTATNPTCYGACNGSGTITVVGGTGPYNYSWCSGESTPIAVALCDMPCVVNITDANGCTAVDFITIAQPAPLQVSVLGPDTTICDPAYITVCAPNAVAYLWSDNSTAACVTTDTSECLFVRMTDTSGCVTIDTICVTDDLCMGIVTPAQDMMNIYPNPATATITIHHGMSAAQNVEIMDLHGRICVANQVSDNETVDVSSLANGIYIVRMNGTEQRLVIAR